MSPTAVDDKTEAHRRRYRPTPTGALATSAAPESDEWFAARRAGITGTDLPKILGDSKYGNALSVWLDKRGELNDTGVSEAGTWGTLLEDTVAREWARRNNVTVRRVGVIQHMDHPHFRASLDRTVHNCTRDGRCGLEVKTRSAFKKGSFKEDIPDDVLAQVAWGRMVSGFDHMHVAVLIGGQELMEFTYEADAGLEQFLINAAQPIWDAVQSGTPPEVEGDADGVLLGILNQMYERRAGDRTVDTEKARALLDDYARGGQIEKDGKGIKEAAKGSLVQLLDDGDTGLIDDSPAYTYKRPSPSTGMPAKEVNRLRTEHPDTFALLEAGGYIVTSQGAPRFAVKG